MKIPHELSELIRKHTDRNDHVQIASRFNVSPINFKHVLFGETKMLDKYKSAIRGIVQRAVENCQQASRDEMVLNSYLINELQSQSLTKSSEEAYKNK